MWRNDLSQPLLVVKGATHNVVSDIAWSADARRLMFTAGECVVAGGGGGRELGGRALSARRWQPVWCARTRCRRSV